jgi:hypothetical protein
MTNLANEFLHTIEDSGRADSPTNRSFTPSLRNTAAQRNTPGHQILMIAAEHFMAADASF